jgi:hypothetical protein
MPRETAGAESAERQRQKSEVQAVLGSELFRRAPSLRQMLAYICERYFADQTAVIKEYDIAVEALGRGPDFDPSVDTIVRVEAFRLRKRLKEYYAREGADHAIHIALPSPGYVPQFIDRQTAPASAPLSAGGREAQKTERPATRARQMWVGVAVAGGLLLSIAGGLVLLSARSTPLEESKAAAPPAPGATPLSADGGIRIVAGLMRPQFVDSLGHTWSGDRYFTGGTASESLSGEVVGVLDPIIYRTSRRGAFRYDIPLQPGIYEMRLLFIERHYGRGDRAYSGEGSRVFHVEVNGVRRLESVDILADTAIPDIPADRVLTDVSPDRDGYLHLAFVPVVGAATVSGIEIVPGLRGRMKPVRIVAGGRSYYDRAGQFWGADRYFFGGRPATMPAVVRQTSDPALYTYGRWGRFNYSIPVAPEGRYRATLKFAETYYGPTNPGRTGVGSRVYDVYCNGVALLRGFDVLKETRENTALDKVFHGLIPNAQGKLVFSFVPVKSYASVHSIEIVDERP